MNTYIIQVRQRGRAQEESKIYLMGPGQAHRSSLVYNLCCCLILVVCVIETYQLTKPCLFFIFLIQGKSRVVCENFQCILPCQ